MYVVVVAFLFIGVTHKRNYRYNQTLATVGNPMRFATSKLESQEDCGRTVAVLLSDALQISPTPLSLSLFPSSLFLSLSPTTVGSLFIFGPCSTGRVPPMPLEL